MLERVIAILVILIPVIYLWVVKEKKQVLYLVLAAIVYVLLSSLYFNYELGKYFSEIVNTTKLYPYILVLWLVSVITLLILLIKAWLKIFFHLVGLLFGIN